MLLLVLVLVANALNNTLTMRFITSLDDFQDNPTKVNDFGILIYEMTNRIYLRAKRHNYHTSVEMFSDPCVYDLYGFYLKGKGSLNTCTKEVNFVLDNNNYKINYKPLNDFSKESELEYTKEKVSYSRTSLYPEVNKPDKKLFKIGIFIINGRKRSEKLGTNIVNNSIEIFKEMKKIYENTLISPILMGILNLKTDLIRKKSILEDFKNFVVDMRFSPYNLESNMNKSDLVVYIDEVDNLENKYGMTYYGGSSRLDTSYSVVLTTPKDSDYYIAKKLAHEVAHSLGVHHDSKTGYLMEETTCYDCNDLLRVFSNESINEMNTFIIKNKRVYQKSYKRNFVKEEVIYSLDDAMEYVNERRKHNFEDIVNNKLNGRRPIYDSSTSNSFSIALLIYGVVLTVCVYCLK